MATPIFSRSPRIVTISGTANQTTSIEIFLWNDPASIPTTANYTLSKPIPSSVVTSTYYDISPYCREFISHSTFTAVTSDTVLPVGEYCNVTVKTYLAGALTSTTSYLAVDGYGYFEDGNNPSAGYVYMTEGTYYISDTGGCGGLTYYDDQSLTWTAVYTGLSTGGSTTVTLAETMGYIPLVHTSYIGEGNTLELKQNAVLQKTYTIEEVCESRYTLMNCDFVNKFGAWQRLVFFKASHVNMTMSNKEFNLMPEAIAYTVTDNIKQSFNTNGQESIKCNTGWCPESYSEVMKELLLSEKVMINNEPVKLRTKSLKLFKNINDKTINYEIEFDYSHEILNYVL